MLPGTSVPYLVTVRKSPQMSNLLWMRCHSCKILSSHCSQNHQTVKH
nr:MAG TPA: hypothetical protein [Caudoviricetes sp.]